MNLAQAVVARYPSVRRGHRPTSLRADLIFSALNALPRTGAYAYGGA
jgi:hypothetical protein